MVQKSWTTVQNLVLILLMSLRLMYYKRRQSSTSADSVAMRSNYRDKIAISFFGFFSRLRFGICPFIGVKKKFLVMNSYVIALLVAVIFPDRKSVV